jgi:hypothetical protein
MFNLIQKKISLFCILLISIYSSYAQPKEVEMADAMRANGKIYVVVAVLALILLGLFVFLIRLDRKISKLEKQKQ